MWHWTSKETAHRTSLHSLQIRWLRPAHIMRKFSEINRRERSIPIHIYKFLSCTKRVPRQNSISSYCKLKTPFGYREKKEREQEKAWRLVLCHFLANQAINKRKKKKWNEKKRKKNEAKIGEKVQTKRKKRTEREGKGNRESRKNSVSGVLAWNKETEARNPRRNPIVLLQLQILIWTTSYACVSVCERKSASENKGESRWSRIQSGRVQKSVFIVTVIPWRAVSWVLT